MCEIDDWRNIPVLINNFNRLKSMKGMVRSLVGWGCRAIYVVDNDSSFPPLLRWYARQTRAKLLLLGENRGHRAPWSKGVLDQIDCRYYIVSDSDLDIRLCPPDTVSHILELLKRNTHLHKVGLSLEIEDLPDESPVKKSVVDWESQYWRHRVSEGVFSAPVDTTFAIYDRERNFNSFLVPSVRTDRPYIARHLPWYLTPNSLTAEDMFYLAHSKTESHWTKTLQQLFREYHAV